MPEVIRSPFFTSRPVAAPTADRKVVMNDASTSSGTTPLTPNVGTETWARADETRRAISRAAACMPARLNGAWGLQAAGSGADAAPVSPAWRLFADGPIAASISVHRLNSGAGALPP